MHCSSLDWPNHLPWVLLTLRTAPWEDNGLSPAQAVYGAPLNLPADRQDTLCPELPLEQALETLNLTHNAATPLAMRHNTAADRVPPDIIPEALRTAEHVLVCRNTPLTPLYDSPYTVIRRSEHHFTLQIGNRQDNIHVQRLKPFAAQHIPTATPPKGGRPRVHFNIPADPNAQMPGTIFPPRPPGSFFSCPGSVSTDRQRPERQRCPPERFGFDL